MKGPHYPVRWLAGLAAVLALAWWWPPAADSQHPQPVTPTLAPAAPPTAAAPAPPAPAADPEAARPWFRLPAVWDLCGIGRMPMTGKPGPEGLVELPAHLGAQPLAEARERTLAALRAGDVRARAAEMLLRPLQAGTGMLGDGVDEAFLPLVLSSRDPVATIWAFSVCRGGARGDDCLRKAAQALVEADPDNAAAWGLWMRWAPDPDAAWRRLLQAPRWDSYFGALSRTVAAAIPPDVPGYLRAGLLYATLALDPVLAQTPGGIWQRCSATPGDCDRLATLLTERGDTLLAHQMGRSIARKAGWPAERMAALDAESQALRTTAEAFGLAHVEQPLSCSALQAWEQRLAAMAAGGELRHLRDERERQRTR